jgi:hypothetical protein
MMASAIAVMMRMIPRKKLMPRRGFGVGKSFCAFTAHIPV